jgi:uncharacterized OB-fold protein
MSNSDYQIDSSDTQRHNSSRIVNRSGWRCRVCGHINLAETEYCSKCGYRSDAQRYFR